MSAAALALTGYAIGDVVEITHPGTLYTGRAGEVLDAHHSGPVLYLQLHLPACRGEQAEEIRIRTDAVSRVPTIHAGTDAQEAAA